MQKQTQWHSRFPDVSPCAVEDGFISLQNPDQTRKQTSDLASQVWGSDCSLSTGDQLPSAVDVWAFFSCFVLGKFWDRLSPCDSDQANLQPWTWTQTPASGLKVYTTTPTPPCCFVLFCFWNGIWSWGLDRLALNNHARIKGRHQHKLFFLNLTFFF